jgi:DNA anti-recombination protein RmuC
MDITGTKKKIQRASKIAEKSYKKMNELLERVQGMEKDLETTSQQVDRMEYEMAEQRALLEAIATQQGLEVDDVLEAADLPEPPETDAETEDDGETTEDDAETVEKATSRPSAADE